MECVMYQLTALINVCWPEADIGGTKCFKIDAISTLACINIVKLFNKIKIKKCEIK